MADIILPEMHNEKRKKLNCEAIVIEDQKKQSNLKAAERMYHMHQRAHTLLHKDLTTTVITQNKKDM
eukprot:11616497-Ditylum_brightwellii.AAC.1